MAERPPLSGPKRRVWHIAGLVIVGASFALMIVALVVRLDSGAGLKGGEPQCDAAPGCDEAIGRVGVPGFVLLVLGAFVLGRVRGGSMFSRRRAPLDSRPRLISRTLTQTVTRYRSTWDGPVVDGETTTRHESEDPLSPADADRLRQTMEHPQSRVVVEGSASEVDIRGLIAALGGNDTELAHTVDPAGSSSRGISRSAASALLVAGAAVALVYAQLVL